MSNSKAWGGRAIGICAAAFIAGQITGCANREPSAPSAVPISGKADLEIVLADGTSVRLDDAKSSGESLCGVVHQCLGPSCGRVRLDHGVAKQDVVTLKERKVEDLRTLQKFDRVDEKPFQAVAALSELLERAYSLLARPFVREMSPEWLAKARRNMHPLRVQYWAFSDKNPLLWALPYMAKAAANNRKPRSADNDSVKLEKLVSELVSASLDRWAGPGRVRPHLGVHYDRSALYA